MTDERLSEEKKARIKKYREVVIEQMAMMPNPKNEYEAELQRALKEYSNFMLKVTDRIMKEDNEKNGR